MKAFAQKCKFWAFVRKLVPSDIKYSHFLLSQSHKRTVFHRKRVKSNCSLVAVRRIHPTPPPPPIQLSFYILPHFAAYVSTQWRWCVLRVCMLLPAWAELAGEERTDYHFPQCVYCWSPGGDFGVAATSARLELSEPLRSRLRHPQQLTLLQPRHAQMSRRRLIQYVRLTMRTH